MLSPQHTAYSHFSQKASCLSFLCGQGASPSCASPERSPVRKLSCLTPNPPSLLCSVRLDGAGALDTFQSTATPWRAMPKGGAKGGRLQGNGGRRDWLPSLGLLFLPASIHLGIRASCLQPAFESGLQHLENFQKQPYRAPRRYEHQQAMLLS